MAFNPNDHITKLPRKTKDKETGEYITVHDDYLEVKWRLIWFREAFPSGTIDTEEVEVDLDREFEQEGAIRWVPNPAQPGKNKKEIYTKRVKGYARYRAIVTDGIGGRGTGTKTETALDFPDFCEKAETGAIGRALAALGFGTQFAPEFNEGERIVDSPTHPSLEKNDEKKSTESHTPSLSPKGKVTPAVPLPTTTPAPEPEKLATSEQITQISSLCEASGVYEWKHLLSLAKLPESVEKWTERQAVAFIASTEGWPGSPMQQEWVAKIASKEQRNAVMAFCQPEQYGTTAVLALRDRLDDTKGVKSENFTNGMVDHLLAYLLAAKETVTRAKQHDKQFTMAKALGVSHPLDFYAAGEAQEQGLTTYLTKLNLLSPPKKQEQSKEVA